MLLTLLSNLGMFGGAIPASPPGVVSDGLGQHRIYLRDRRKKLRKRPIDEILGNVTKEYFDKIIEEEDEIILLMIH